MNSQPFFDNSILDMSIEAYKITRKIDVCTPALRIKRILGYEFIIDTHEPTYNMCKTFNKLKQIDKIQHTFFYSGVLKFYIRWDSGYYINDYEICGDDMDVIADLVDNGKPLFVKFAIKTEANGKIYIDSYKISWDEYDVFPNYILNTSIRYLPYDMEIIIDKCLHDIRLDICKFWTSDICIEHRKYWYIWHKKQMNMLHMELHINTVASRN